MTATDAVLTVEPATIEVSDAVNLALSAWLRPGHPPCGACLGRGRNPGDPDLCPVCSGWGSADPDPATMRIAPDGTACAACGRRPADRDPVLADPAGQGIHRSHLAAAHGRYRLALSAYMSREAS